MKWISFKEQKPEKGKLVILAKKSLYLRPSHHIKSTFFSVFLVHPASQYPEFDQGLYLWCKAALHLPANDKFSWNTFFEEISQPHIPEREKIYIKASPLDWWLELTDPESIGEFDI